MSDEPKEHGYIHRATSESIAKLVGAIRAARSAMGKIEASGENRFDKYKYSSVKDYVDGLEQGLSQHGLIVVVTASRPWWVDAFFDKEQAKPARYCRVEIYGRVYHESGEWIEFSGWGEALDRSDKAYYKAFTGARKYVLAGLFDLKAGTDPESDEGVSRATAGRRGEREEKREDNPFRGQRQQQQPPRQQPPPAQAPSMSELMAKTTIPSDLLTIVLKALADPQRIIRDDKTANWWERVLNFSRKHIAEKGWIGSDVALLNEALSRIEENVHAHRHPAPPPEPEVEPDFDGDIDIDGEWRGQ